MNGTAQLAAVVAVCKWLSPLQCVGCRCAGLPFPVDLFAGDKTKTAIPTVASILPLGCWCSLLFSDAVSLSALPLLGYLPLSPAGRSWFDVGGVLAVKRVASGARHIAGPRRTLFPGSSRRGEEKWITFSRPTTRQIRRLRRMASLLEDAKQKCKATCFSSPRFFFVYSVFPSRSEWTRDQTKQTNSNSSYRFCCSSLAASHQHQQKLKQRASWSCFLCELCSGKGCFCCKWKSLLKWLLKSVMQADDGGGSASGASVSGPAVTALALHSTVSVLLAAFPFLSFFFLFSAAVAVNETQSAELTSIPSQRYRLRCLTAFICLASSLLPSSLHCQAQIAFSPSRALLFTLFLANRRVTSSRQPSDTRFLYRRRPTTTALSTTIDSISTLCSIAPPKALSGPINTERVHTYWLLPATVEHLSLLIGKRGKQWKRDTDCRLQSNTAHTDIPTWAHRNHTLHNGKLN